MIKHIGIFVLVSVATYAGSTVFHPLAIAGCEIDFGILAMAIVIANYRPNIALLWGFYSGILIDSFNPDYMGAGTLSRSLATATLCFLHNKLNIEHPFWYGTIIFVASLIDKTIYAIALGWNERFFFSFLRFFLPSATYNATVAVLIILIVSFFRKRKHRIL